MKKTYSVVLLEKDLDGGLTIGEINNLFGKLHGPEGIPVEFQGECGTAMGFIDLAEAETMSYDYTMLSEFVTEILNDMEKEHADCSYVFSTSDRDYDILLTRN